MELRIESVIVFAIAIIVTGTMVLKIDSTTQKNDVSTKELEFTNTTFTEVDTQKLHGRAYGTYGIRDNGTLRLEDMVYFTDTIKHLVSDKGDYVDDVLNLEGNIILEEKQGYTFKTQKAVYNQNTELLRVHAPFQATMDKNFFQGTRLVYHTRTKDLYAENVRAVYHTAETKDEVQSPR